MNRRQFLYTAVCLALTGCKSSSPSSSQSIPPTNSPTSNAVVQWSAVAADNFGKTGSVEFIHSRIDMTGPGRATINVKRHEGAQGAVSFRISSFDITGACAMSSPNNYGALNEVVNFTDGEVGVKSVELNITSVPTTGLHKIGLQITESTLSLRVKQQYAYIYIDDGGVNPGFTIIDTSTGNVGNIADVVSTSAAAVDANMQGAPIGEIVVGDIAAAINTASAGDGIYLRGGSYFDNRRISGRDRAGVYINNAGTAAAPITLASYPGEVAVLDQQYSDCSDQAGAFWVSGFTFNTTAAHIHFQKLEITRAVVSGFNINTAGAHHIIIEECHIHNIRSKNSSSKTGARDNIAAIRMDACTDNVYRRCKIHDIYSETSTSNPFTAVAAGLHSGIHGYRCARELVEECTIYNVGKANFLKAPNSALNDGRYIHRCFFYNVADTCFEIGVAGSGSPAGFNSAFHDNLALLNAATASDVSCVRVIFRGDVTMQPDGLFISGNTQVGGDMLFYTQTMTTVVAYNNNVSNTELCIAIEDNIRTYKNELRFCDFNNWHNQTVYRFITGRSGSNLNYTGIANWASADFNADPVLARSVAGNSLSMNPNFVSASDYRTLGGPLVGTGLYSRDIGIGNLIVGENNRAIS